ncbi:hypothetical protein CK203_018507 [Vitis vinifera]|uniref:Uncharacterized protein n=1 Tax=Vitis vinifera TaxID=29760 RepID=A0A438J603_VITVI|nr:hypothetical protein CK203_018507 [Vitis vinifera]
MSRCDLPIGIGRLKNLQSVKGVYARGSISRELGCLTQLRELGVVLNDYDVGFSHLFENPNAVLQFLPNLKQLTLWQAYNAKQIGKEFCPVGGFPKLEVLVIASTT